MALIGNNADTLFHGLSAFWHRFFRDAGDLQRTYEGTEILLGQAYLDFMSDVLNTSIVEAPLFRKEFYKLITAREDQLVFKERGAVIVVPPVPEFYGNPGTDRYVLTSSTFYGGIPQLQDTIYAPKASLESGIDYKVMGGEIQFKNDPTDPLLPGFAKRRVVVGIGGKFTSTTTTNWVGAGVQKGDTLYYSETIDLGTGSPLNAQDTARKAKIVHVTASHLSVSVDTPFPEFPAGAEPSGFSWRVMRTKDDGTYNLTLPRAPGAIAPFNNGKIERVTVSGRLENITTLEVNEISFWAVDAKVDDLTLYNTYGYFFTDKHLSSESYRSLLRGLMQLYIMGPALARVESALNLTAGLPTIREEGELLRYYDSGILGTGITGQILPGEIFQVPTPLFAPTSVGGYIKISASDFSSNVGTFNIVAYISPTQVKLPTGFPFVPNTGLVWTYTKTNKQTITTDKGYYDYPLGIPLRDDIKNNSNFDVLTFKAFEVLTTAIRVTDYVQDPEWWHTITIPTEILPEWASTQRVVTPQLYPNILGPIGNAIIGDPGYYLGRDEDSPIEGSGIHGLLIPGLNTFDAVDSAPFTNASVGGVVQITSMAVGNGGVFQILSMNSPSQVVLQPGAFPFQAEFDLTWSTYRHNAAVPYRHKASFILMDRFLKLHMFAVLVDAAVSLTGILVSDLQKLLKDVKPVHTALYFRPLTEFNDFIDLTDVIAVHMWRRRLERVGIIDNQWRIGSAWLIGDAWTYPGPVGGAILTGLGGTAMFVAIGGADPLINAADPTNVPPATDPPYMDDIAYPTDCHWIDRPLYVYKRPWP
jgi:hypothetical protein